MLLRSYSEISGGGGWNPSGGGKVLPPPPRVSDPADITFKGTVGNRKLPSLHGGSFEITLTVPLKNDLFVANSNILGLYIFTI